MVDNQAVTQHFKQMIIAFRQLKQAPDAPKGQFHGRFRILKSLQKKGDVSQRELAELVSMKPGSLTEALENLEREKLVIRKRDEHDHRVVRVALTEAGQAEENRLTNNFNEFEKSLFGVLTDEERSQLITIVDKLTNQLKRMKEEHCNG